MLRPSLALVAALTACTSPEPAGGSDAGFDDTDAAVSTDGATPVDARPSVDAPPPIDAAPPAPCDTVPGNRTVTGGEVVTTCLSSDADEDHFHFTAPTANRAGGTLRFRLDFTECELTFAVYIDADAQYPWSRANQSTTITDPSQLDHHFIGIVAPGSAYTLKVQKRVPFTGTCAYTLTTTFTPIDDPYEPNQEAADAKAITVGQQVSAYLGCVSPTTDVYISDHCQDSYTATLPVGHYNLTYSLTDFANMNPCLNVYCRDESVMPNVVTHNEQTCHSSSSSTQYWSSTFNFLRPSKCYIGLGGSSAGVIMDAYTSQTYQSNLRGTRTPYSLKLVQTGT